MRSLIFFASLLVPSAMAQGAAPPPPKFARIARDAQSLPCAVPDYPKASRRNQETGHTTIRHAVTAAGAVADMEVVKSSGYRDLDRAAVAALRECRFTPASIAGKPVQAVMLTQYDWNLE